MLSSGRFTTRYFLVAIIFIYVIISSFLLCFESKIYYTTYFSGRNISSDMLIQIFVNCLPGILIFVVFSSPPLLSLFLLRRPSFWRVLLHMATAFYILLIIYIVYIFAPNLLWKYVTFTFLLVYSGAALVAGLPEATAAGRRARLVYYAALPLWIYFLIYSMISAMGRIGKFL